MEWDETGSGAVMSVMGALAHDGRPERFEGQAHGRDWELVRFVGAHGAVAIEHVMAALGVGRTAAYRRVAFCVEAGLLQRLDLLRGMPSVLRATPTGLRYAGLGLPVAAISPGSVDHWLRCASTAFLLGSEFGADVILSERELRRLEEGERRPLVSAKVGELPSGAPRLHRPDLAVIAGERPIAVEVELTPKAPRRLEALIRAWRRADWIAEVRYYCEPGLTRRAVERAVERTHAQERVRVLEAVPR